MSVRSSREPERTCVSCRLQGSKRDLLRFVRGADGAVRVDTTGRASGRGAYAHRTQECVTGAIRHGGIGRSLRMRLDAPEAARLMDRALEAVRDTA